MGKTTLTPEAWQSAGLQDCGSMADRAPRSPRSGDHPRGSESPEAGAGTATVRLSDQVCVRVSTSVSVEPARRVRAARYGGHGAATPRARCRARAPSFGSRTASGGAWVT